MVIRKIICAHSVCSSKCYIFCMGLRIAVKSATLAMLLAAAALGCSSYGGNSGSEQAGGGSSAAGSAGTALSAGGSGGAVASAGSAAGGTLNMAGGPAAAGAAGLGVAGAASAGAGGGGSRPSLRTVGYLPSYRGMLSQWATSLDFSLVSYVNVCFGAVDASGNVSYPDAGLPAFAAAAHAHGAKVCMALGGADTINNFAVIGAQITAANRKPFVQKITDYAVSTGLDCIDVDFEGNGVNADYEGFVTELGASLHAKNLELTAAMASWFGDKITSNAIHAFDFVNVMAYDLHNPGGNAAPVQSSSMADSTAELQYFIGRGLSKDKAVFGVPFYGYRWKAGDAVGTAVVYAELLSTYGAAAANDMIVQGDTTIYLNSKATIVAKTQLAKQYGGIMSWELGQDAAGGASLLRAIHDAQL